MYKREEIENRLRTELQDARRRFEAAAAEFGVVTASPSSVAPYPDSIMRMKRVGVEQRMATQALREALRRWNDFVIDGKMPDDLSPPLRKSS